MATKGVLDLARGVLGGIRRRVGQFFRELAEDASGPSSRGRRLEPIQQPQRQSLLQQYQTDFIDRVTDLSHRYASGDIDLTQWRAQVGLEVRTLHFSARVMGAGGIGSLTPEDISEIEQSVQTQLAYLNRWSRQLDNQQSINETQVVNRAKLYAGASSETFSRAMVAALGLPPLPFYPAHGTECRTNCGCGWRIVKLEGEGNYDCYWERHKDDSCPTCLARERKYGRSPLQIRNGRYVSPNEADLIV